MNKVKQIFATVMAVTTMAIGCSGISASATSTSVRTIDNDSIASGYSNEDLRGVYTYITATSLYNGDARCTSSSNSPGEYYYQYPNLSVTGTGSPATFTIHVGAYLNHASFTDTLASYYVEYASNVFNRVDTNVIPSTE